MIYVCADIHGRKDKFDRLLGKTSLQRDDKLIITCVNKGTLDESPFAYKPMDEIVANIEPTAEIVSKVKPIYNFKAGDEE